MNTSLKMVLGLTLVVVMSAGLAMAGRGGGRGGGGGHAGGVSRPAHTHTPSFSTPHPSFNTPRPAATPAFRPSLPQHAGANRPAVTPRISERPALANMPHAENRPSGAGRPNFDYRPNVNLGNRSNVGNRMNIGNNVNIANRTNNIVRPTHTDWNHGDWHHGDWHSNWNHFWYYRPVGWWTAGYWAGAAASATPWAWGYWPYYNPYYTGPVVYDGGSFAFDYSQPIVVAETPVTQTGLTAEQQAAPLFDAARNAFMQGDYPTALAQVDQAIAQVPNDTVLHEFRGLVLFALGRYKEAAGTVYAVLSTGPGWDWTTLSGLYPNVDVYTQQLRALEQYARSHPAAPDVRFLLAYHYLTCGYTDAAVERLKEVTRLNPRDQLSAQLLTSLSATDTAEQSESSQPAALTKPADASSLVGNWTATRADGATIKLALAGDGKFTWALDQNGKPQQFSGTYTVADNLLVLKQGDHPMMVGQVASLDGDRFNFKLAGDNPRDPGLTFAR